MNKSYSYINFLNEFTYFKNFINNLSINNKQIIEYTEKNCYLTNVKYIQLTIKKEFDINSKSNNNINHLNKVLNNSNNILIDESENTYDNNSIIFDIDILYSDVYNAPVMYFTITDLNSNKIITIDDYKNLLNLNTDNDILKFNNTNYFFLLNNKAKNIEIKKTNFPLSGKIKLSLYLCNFNTLINEVYKNNKDNCKNNVLSLWFSIVYNFLGL